MPKTSLFFKERFLAKDHPDRSKMDRFSIKLRKLGLREETIGYGPSKEKWEVWNRERQINQSNPGLDRTRLRTMIPP